MAKAKTRKKITHVPARRARKAKPAKTASAPALTNAEYQALERRAVGNE